MWKVYTCNSCGHEVTSQEKPEKIRWSDGHVCFFSVNENLTCESCNGEPYCDLESFQDCQYNPANQ